MYHGYFILSIKTIDIELNKGYCRFMNENVSWKPTRVFDLTPEIEQGCQQIMSPDPDSTESCPDPLMCLTCGSCEDHCHCTCPLTFDKIKGGESEQS